MEIRSIDPRADAMAVTAASPAGLRPGPGMVDECPGIRPLHLGEATLSRETIRSALAEAPVDIPAAGARLSEAVAKVVAIDDRTLEYLIVALFARGHVLIEGIPGIGKTLLARTLSRSVHAEFNRVQFTNDLMPSDIVGSMVWRPGVEKFSFVRGPLFANLVLADEINRSSPRTLSCLLEAMESGRVSVEGRSLELADPFFVLATRNPIEFHGTFPVPEAALDRFLMRIELDYPSADEELALYLGHDPEQELATLEPVLQMEQLRDILDRVPTVRVSEAVARYAQLVVQRSRKHERIALGASPRAAMTWLRAARALAALRGRDYVLPDDLQHIAAPVLAHRIFLAGGGDAIEVLQELIDTTPVEV